MKQRSVQATQKHVTRMTTTLRSAIGWNSFSFHPPRRTNDDDDTMHPRSKQSAVSAVPYPHPPPCSQARQHCRACPGTAGWATATGIARAPPPPSASPSPPSIASSLTPSIASSCLPWMSRPPHGRTGFGRSRRRSSTWTTSTSRSSGSMLHGGVRSRVIKILLLGQSESGKSTTLKCVFCLFSLHCRVLMIRCQSSNFFIHPLPSTRNTWHGGSSSTSTSSVLSAESSTPLGPFEIGIGLTSWMMAENICSGRMETWMSESQPWRWQLPSGRKKSKFLEGVFYYYRENHYLDDLSDLFPSLASQLARFDPQYNHTFFEVLRSTAMLSRWAWNRNSTAWSVDHSPHAKGSSQSLLCSGNLRELSQVHLFKEVIQILVQFDGLGLKFRILITSLPGAHRLYMPMTLGDNLHFASIVLHDIDKNISHTMTFKHILNQSSMIYPEAFLVFQRTGRQLSSLKNSSITAEISSHTQQRLHGSLVTTLYRIQLVSFEGSSTWTRVNAPPVPTARASIVTSTLTSFTWASFRKLCQKILTKNTLNAFNKSLPQLCAHALRWMQVYVGNFCLCQQMIFEMRCRTYVLS